MCGRFALETTAEQLSLFFNLRKKVTLAPRYNIAPSQPIPIIREIDGRKFSMVRWGLIPHWAKDSKIGYKLINARAETVAEKPSFRDAFKSRRCLIPTTGFYEWKTEGKSKRPYFIKMKNGALFAMAGIWESWRNPDDGKIIESCAIITTEANGIVGKIHDRMPVIIPQESSGLWLSSSRDGERFRAYMQPYSPFKMTSYQVSGMVSDPKNEGPGCMRKIEY
ncbi:MAG: SOS response-associated peptidase [Desulfobulbaceae bacterium]|nr:SOS response-associated peptidase [Desulfobulbaceae bacterium]